MAARYGQIGYERIGSGGWVRGWDRGWDKGRYDRVQIGLDQAMYGPELRYWTVPAFFKVTAWEDMLHEGVRRLQNLLEHGFTGCTFALHFRTLWSQIAR